MTRDDERLPAHTTTGTRRQDRKKRTRGVGRTGARFPSTTALDDEPGADLPAQAPEPPPAAVPIAPPRTGSPGAHPTAHDTAHDPGSTAHGNTGHSSAVHGNTVHGSAGDDSAGDDSAGDDSAGDDSAAHDSAVHGSVGRTGARFGPYSARKPKRAKGNVGLADDSRGTGTPPGESLHERSAARRTPPGEPTPERSAERTTPLVMPWAGALVRPYAHTGGRTRSGHDLAVEALVSRGGGAGAGGVPTTRHGRAIVELCAQPRSVAEVAALLGVPLGVARVLLGDLAAAGAVTVHPTAGGAGDGAPDLDVMRRVLVGLRRW